MKAIAHEVAVMPLTCYELHLAREMVNRRYAPEFSRREPEEQLVCHETEYCEGCPYPAHGFVCWGGHGGCLRVFAEKKKKGASQTG